MASYRKSPEAEADLIDIWRYIAKDGKRAATKFIDRLHRHMGELAAQPGMGRSRSEFGKGVGASRSKTSSSSIPRASLGSMSSAFSRPGATCAHSSSGIDPPIFSGEEAVEGEVLRE